MSSVDVRSHDVKADEGQQSAAGPATEERDGTSQDAAAAAADATEDDLPADEDGKILQLHPP